VNHICPNTKYWTMPLKLCILGNGPKWLLITASRISKNGFTKEGGKKLPTDACLSTVFFSLFLSPFLSLSLCYFCFSSLCFLASGSSLSTTIAIIYTWLILWDFSILSLGLHQLFLIYGGHPFRVVHQPIGCPFTTTTGHAQCILFLPLLVI